MSYQKHNFEAGAVLFASQLNDMDNQIEYLSNQGSSFSDDFKTALLNCFENVAWINENGQTYYDALYDSLYPDNMWFITNVLNGCVTSNNATSIFKNNSYVATITAEQGYTLNGATVNIIMGGNDVTNLYYSSGSINIPNVTGDLVITVLATSAVTSISAVFTPEQNTPVTIDPTRVSAYIATDGRWIASSDSYSVCVPVINGKRYKFQFSSTSSTDVGTIFRFGFTDSSTPTEQTLTGWVRSTPQDYVATEITASGSYLVIQLGGSVASSVISNEYLALTKLGTVIYDTDSLNTLKQYLTVTATYADTTTAIVTNYTLSGTLTEGTSTITVSYGGKTDTFNVTVVRYWDISWDYTMGTPIGNGWLTGTTLPGVMESDGFKLSSTSSAGGELHHDPDITDNKGIFEVEITFSQIGSTYQGFCIFSPGMRLRIYSGKLLFNGSSTNTEASQTQIANIFANTKYTIRWEYVKANYAKVYVDGTLVHTQSSALADSTTRLFVNNTPSSSSVATIHAIRFREVS